MIICLIQNTSKTHSSCIKFNNFKMKFPIQMQQFIQVTRWIYQKGCSNPRSGVWRIWKLMNECLKPLRDTGLLIFPMQNRFYCQAFPVWTSSEREKKNTMQRHTVHVVLMMNTESDSINMYKIYVIRIWSTVTFIQLNTPTLYWW